MPKVTGIRLPGKYRRNSVQRATNETAQAAGGGGD
jgi:hypothetical protein